MLSLSPPCEVNLIQNFGVLLLIFLLFSFLEYKEENECGSTEAEDENAADSKRLRTSITGHRVMKTLVFTTVNGAIALVESVSISSSSIVTSLPSTVADAVW